MNANVPPPAADGDPAGLAIATVLRAESQAQASIEQARAQADAIAESARAGARALAERTERRIRSVVSAFERDLGARLAAIDAEAERMAVAHVLGDDEIASLRRAVAGLARELTSPAADAS